MNKQKPNSGIDYADYSWNPVVGCSNYACPVRKDCWARRISKRVGEILGCEKCKKFEPHTHLGRLDEPDRIQKPSVVAVGFMGDLFDPRLDRWNVIEIIKAMERIKQHNYLLLTKRYDARIPKADFLYQTTSHIYLGVSVSKSLDDKSIQAIQELAPRWVSFEPAFPSLDIVLDRLLAENSSVEQVVIGFLTKGRKVYPQVDRKDLERALHICEERKVAVWLKSNTNVVGFRDMFERREWRRLIWRRKK